ncbi:MAG: hypothetical protein WDO17_13715 [Alphaproteobacteria bacterium]
MAKSKAEQQRERFMAYAMDMEVPLRDATQYVMALCLIGQGLREHDSEHGDAVNAVAWAAYQRLEALTDLWNKAHGAAARRGKR